MTTVRAIFSGFIGHAGRTVELAEGDVYATDHPLVQGRPELFTREDAGTLAVTAVPGPVRAVETVGQIEEVEPDALEAGPLSTVTAAPIVRRGRKSKSV